MALLANAGEQGAELRCFFRVLRDEIGALAGIGAEVEELGAGRVGRVAVFLLPGGISAGDVAGRGIHEEPLVVPDGIMVRLGVVDVGGADGLGRFALEQ